MPNLLLEIGAEELPASYIEPALDALCEAIRALASESSLGDVQMQSAATPRRLAVFAQGLVERQEDVETEVTGPPRRIAFGEDGEPTKAGAGFAKSQGVDLADVYFKDTPKGEYCAVRKRIEGKPAADILAEALPDIITGLPFPKSMRWHADAVRFARPIRTLIALLDSDVIDFELAGVKAGRATYGHPFLCPGSVELAAADFDAYVDLLRERKVIALIDERKSMTRELLQAKLDAYGSQLDDDELLEDVTNLVEYPAVLEGRFAEKYLQIPAEVVVEAMREHQKYFAVYGREGALQNRFLAVINRDDAHLDSIREGNERVLAARLADAEFFWREDVATRLEDKVERLQGVLFHDRLGNYYTRAERVATLAQQLGRDMGLSEETIGMAARTAVLCKADLVTLMVGEFPKLQGTMGKLYALHDGETAEVAEAIAEHYLPRYANDKLPQTETGALVSVAEKLDAIVGLFSIGLVPTGSQDPYALRRQAQGVIRIVRDRGLSLSLSNAVVGAQAQMPTSRESKREWVEAIFTFFRDRLNQMVLDEGRRYDIVNAVLATGVDNINNAFERLDAVTELSQTEQWPGLVEVVERTFNISKKCPADVKVDPALFEGDEEKQLWAVLDEHRERITALIDSKDYQAAAVAYHEAFAKPVHEFFDKVFVNVDDAAVKKNRLLLMKRINELYTTNIADLSKVVLDEQG